jgi:hypothetical protein
VTLELVLTPCVNTNTNNHLHINFKLEL